MKNVKNSINGTFQTILQERGSARMVKEGQHKNSIATFVVHVKHCQNATWQGTVTWAEENKQENFRSALELLKLLDGAVEQTEGLKVQNKNLE